MRHLPTDIFNGNKEDLIALHRVRRRGQINDLVFMIKTALLLKSRNQMKPNHKPNIKLRPTQFISHLNLFK